MLHTPRLLWIEIKRQLLFVKSYPLQEMSGLAVYYIFFIGLYWSWSEGTVQRHHKQNYFEHLLLGYILWTYAVSAISLLAFDIAEEAQSGTLEQIALVPQQLRPWLVRCFGNFVLQTGRTTILTCLIIITAKKQPPSFSAVEIAVAGVTISGLYGMGLVVGAVTLIFKKTTFFVNIIHFFLFFFTGITTPLDSLPKGLYAVAQFIPLAHGISLINNVASFGSIKYYVVGQSLFFLSIISVLWVTVGITALLSSYRIARVNGLFHKF